jgi:hypothetical protein
MRPTQLLPSPLQPHLPKPRPPPRQHLRLPQRLLPLSSVVPLVDFTDLHFGHVCPMFCSSGCIEIFAPCAQVRSLDVLCHRSRFSISLARDRIRLAKSDHKATRTHHLSSTHVPVTCSYHVEGNRTATFAAKPRPAVAVPYWPTCHTAARLKNSMISPITPFWDS